MFVVSLERTMMEAMPKTVILTSPVSLFQMMLCGCAFVILRVHVLIHTAKKRGERERSEGAP